ncbi:sclerostin domain-containing protein 1 [Elysia marginata]|uniref:Sclerostin domain-containing protein 1 n=1 Tax=Elysia marginata TaxID=1093978 RepID=A0AAV4JKV1_9GAST|nr:sclerostin domain-containing protein 1 [Elysia marginata]
MARNKLKEWECVEDFTRRKRVRLLCQDGSLRTYRIKVVKSCRCERIGSRGNRTSPSKRRRKGKKRRRKSKNLKNRDKKKRNRRKRRRKNKKSRVRGSGKKETTTNNGIGKSKKGRSRPKTLSGS